MEAFFGTLLKHFPIPRISTGTCAGSIKSASAASITAALVAGRSRPR